MANENTEHGQSRVFIAIVLAWVMLFLETGMIFVALPSLKDSLGLSVDASGWIILSYLLVRIVTMPIWGRLSDTIGHRRVFILGISLFLAGTCLAALLPSFALLLAARTVQAVGGGMINAVAPALITANFPESRRGRVFALAEIAGGAAAIIGPFIAGFASEHMGGRLIFLVNVPIGIAALVMCRRVLPESRGLPGERMDTAGSFLLLLFLTPLLVGLNQADDWGWHSPWVLVPICASVVLGCFFFIRNSRVDNPVVDLSLFRVKRFAQGVLADFAMYAAVTTATYVIPFFLEYFLGIRPHYVGMILAISGGVAVAVMYVGGTMADRIGTTVPQLAALVVAAVSLGLLAFCSQSLMFGLIISSMILTGIAGGLFTAANYSAVMSDVPRERLGTAAGLHSTIESLALVSGIVIADALMGRWDDLQGTLLGNEGFGAAVQQTCLVGFILLVVAIAFFLALSQKGRTRSP